MPLLQVAQQLLALLQMPLLLMLLPLLGLTVLQLRLQQQQHHLLLPDLPGQHLLPTQSPCCQQACLWHCQQLLQHPDHVLMLQALLLLRMQLTAQLPGLHQQYDNSTSACGGC